MVILKDNIRPDILARPCERCGESIDVDAEPIVTFYRGSFIMLHDECAKEFIATAEKGPRGKRRDNCQNSQTASQPS